MIYNENHPVLKEELRTEVRSGNTNNNVSHITDQEVFFAKERYNLYQSMPDEGVSIEILKKYFLKKYGF